MPAPTSILGVTGGPPTNPGRLPVEVARGGSGGAIQGLKIREIIGVNFAFGSPAMTDQPLWIRVDDPGSL